MNKLFLEKQENIDAIENLSNKHYQNNKEFYEQIKLFDLEKNKNSIQKMILKAKLIKEHEKTVKSFYKLSDSLKSIKDSKLLFYIGHRVVNGKTRDYYYAYDKDRISYIERTSKLGKEKERVMMDNEIDVHSLCAPLGNYNMSVIMIELSNYVDGKIRKNDFQSWDKLRHSTIQEMAGDKYYAAFENMDISTEKEEILEL